MVICKDGKCHRDYYEMRNPFRKKSFEAISEQRLGVTLSQIIDGLFPDLIRGRKSALIKASIGTVYACISFISADASQVPLRLYTTSKSSNLKTTKIHRKTLEHLKSNRSGIAYRIKGLDEVEEITEHEALKLLWNPNNYTHSARLVSHTLWRLLLTGDAYWYLTKGALDKPNGIHILQPEDCTINEKKNGFREIESYRFGNTEYKPDEIVHFSLVNPRDPYKYGMSPLDSVIEDYNLMGRLKALRNELAKTKPGTSFYIETDKDTKDMKIQQIKEAIKQYRLGQVKVDEVLNITGGRLVPIPMIGADIPFQSDLAILRELICNAYKVPITKFMSASNRAERDLSRVEYYESCIMPHLVDYQETLNNFYLPQFPDTENMFFAFENCVPDDQALQMRLDTGYVQTGIRTINEIRYERNFGEAFDGGDVPYIPANMIPLGQEAIEQQVRAIIDGVMKEMKNGITTAKPTNT